MSLEKWALLVWEAFARRFARMQGVPRSGYQLVGIAPKGESGCTPTSISVAMWNRGESGLEHTGKMMFLALAIACRCCWWRPLMMLTILVTALVHDVGEIERGDIPDDGSAAHDNQERENAERKLVIDTLQCLPRLIRVLVTRVYDSYAGKRGAGLIVYIADKVEAIWTLLICESQGNRGSLSNKPHPTEKDAKAMEKTDTDAAADCWCSGFCEKAKEFPRWLQDIVTALVKVGFRETRGKLPGWLQQF